MPFNFASNCYQNLVCEQNESSGSTHVKCRPLQIPYARMNDPNTLGRRLASHTFETKVKNGMNYLIFHFYQTSQKQTQNHRNALQHIKTQVERLVAPQPRVSMEKKRRCRRTKAEHSNDNSKKLISKEKRGPAAQQHFLSTEVKKCL